MDLVMFDIDGTLVDSNGFDGDLFVQAFQDAAGIDVDRSWHSYRHVTDSGIVAEVLGNLCDPSDAPEIAARIKRRFIELVGDYLRERTAGAEPIPGAAELLQRLAAIDGVAVAIATGGWRETAEIKLAHAGIDTDGIALATSSEAHARIDIMKLAEEMTGIAHFDRRTYFGDGPWDLQASNELGYAFIGVGANVEHSVVVEDFSDADRVLSLLGKN